MARMQTIETWCDQCAEAGEDRTPAVTWVVAINAPGEKVTPLEVDLCEPHGAQLRAFVGVLSDVGRRAGTAPTPGRKPGPPRGRKGTPYTHIGGDCSIPVAEVEDRLNAGLCPIDGCPYATTGTAKTTPRYLVQTHMSGAHRVGYRALIQRKSAERAAVGAA